MEDNYTIIPSKIKDVNKIYIKLGGFIYDNDSKNRIIYIKKNVTDTNNYDVKIIDLSDRKIYILDNLFLDRLIYILDYDAICHSDIIDNKLINNYIYNL